MFRRRPLKNAQPGVLHNDDGHLVVCPFLMALLSGHDILDLGEGGVMTVQATTLLNALRWTRETEQSVTFSLQHPITPPCFAALFSDGSDVNSRMGGSCLDIRNRLQ